MAELKSTTVHTYRLLYMQIVVYADGVVVIVRGRQDLEYAVQKLAKEMASRGLVINQSKTFLKSFFRALEEMQLI